MMTSNLYTVRGEKHTHAHVLIFKDVNGQSVINSVINPLLFFLKKNNKPSSSNYMSAKTLIIKYIILKNQIEFAHESILKSYKIFIYNDSHHFSCSNIK